MKNKFNFFDLIVVILLGFMIGLYTAKGILEHNVIDGCMHIKNEKVEWRTRYYHDEKNFMKDLFIYDPIKKKEIWGWIDYNGDTNVIQMFGHQKEVK